MIFFLSKFTHYQLRIVSWDGSPIKLAIELNVLLLLWNFTHVIVDCYQINIVISVLENLIPFRWVSFVHFYGNFQFELRFKIHFRIEPFLCTLSLEFLIQIRYSSLLFSFYWKHSKLVWKRERGSLNENLKCIYSWYALQPTKQTNKQIYKHT